MSRQLSERASKIKAAENIAAMIARSQPPLGESVEKKIRLKFPKDIWNEYQPGTNEAAISPPKPKTVHKRKRKPADIKTEDNATTKVAKRSPPQPRQCKVKVTRFHYGGPDARVAGKYMNDITLDAPCLQPTCANCWEWHTHLMRSSPAIDTSLNDEHVLTAPEVSPLSPAIDPRILDDTWRVHQNRHNSINDVPGSSMPSPHALGSASPVLTPVNRVTMAQRGANLSTTHASTATPTPSGYNVLLPASVMKYTALHASSKIHWRKSPRQQYIARLSFPTSGGKVRFRALVRELARKEIKLESQRLRRVARQVVTETLMQGTDEASGARRRRRHRVKLMFRSKLGKESYKRLVERYLR